MVAVVGRLVPHKQVEHAIDAVMALRGAVPGPAAARRGERLVGGPAARVRASKGAEDLVVFEGHVDEERKHEVYEQAWLLALPSLKEGWGLVVGEAGMHRTPTVAYRSAGGTRESVADGRSGVLVDDKAGFTDAIAMLLEDAAERERLGDGALEMSHAFTWGHAQRSFALVVLAASRGVRVDAQDPERAPTTAEDETSE